MIEEIGKSFIFNFIHHKQTFKFNPDIEITEISERTEIGPQSTFTKFTYRIEEIGKSFFSTLFTINKLLIQPRDNRDNSDNRDNRDRSSEYIY